MFFKDKEEQVYHKFDVINAGDLPDKFFRSLWRSDFDNARNCYLWISKEITQKASLNWEKGKDYCFLMNLGEHKTTAFNIKNFHTFDRHHTDISNNMILKTKQYFQNTVHKIGFWDSEDYFYEANKKENSPPKPTNQPNSNQPVKNIWVKIALICLPFLIFGLFLLIMVRWMNKRKN